MKLIILALSVIMLFGCSNSQQYSKPSSDAVKDTDSTWVEQIKDQITKELCKTLIDKDFKSRFGIRSNVLTIKEVGQSILGHDFIKAFVEGTMQGVIRGENNTYDFLVVIEFDEKDIASKNRIGMVQLHHKGKSDQFYDWANNVLLSDITIKSQYIYHGVTVTCVDIKPDALRFKTSKKLSYTQIADFVAENTDLRRFNYHFTNGRDDYACFQYKNNEGAVYMYEADNAYLVKNLASKLEFEKMW